MNFMGILLLKLNADLWSTFEVRKLEVGWNAELKYTTHIKQIKVVINVNVVGVGCFCENNATEAASLHVVERT